MHWQGRDAALHAHRVFFAIMFRDVSLTLEAIESIVGTGHCRVAVVRWALGDYTVLTGERIVGERNRMTLVFTGEGDASTNRPPRMILGQVLAERSFFSLASGHFY